MSEVETLIRANVRDVQDFPKKGIIFKDITPLFQNPLINAKMLEALVVQAKSCKADVVVGVDSRGFLMGNALAMKLGVPFVMARKKGKLPYKKISETYALEYGVDEIEMHTDSFATNKKVLIHDDLLATGGTANCVAKMVERLDAEVVGFSFIINLEFLNGKDILSEYSGNIMSLVSYQ